MTLEVIKLNCSEWCGNVTLEFNIPLYIYDQIPNIILISTYVPLFLIALACNIVVIVTVSSYRSLRSVTNYFLVNLSVADLLITLICMPMAVGQAIYSLWIYGDIMCKLTHYLKGVAVTASVFTITAMSIDRYMAIRHPMSRKLINRRTTSKVICVIWCLALIIFSPILFVRRAEGFKFEWDSKEYLHCIEVWPDQFSQKMFGIFCFIMVYLIPGCIVISAYSLMGFRLCSRQLLPEYETAHENIEISTGGLNSTHSAWQVSAVGGRLIRERRRVAKILLVLAVVFSFCWLPYSILSLILDIHAKQGPPPNAEETAGESQGSFSEGDEQLTIVNLLLPFAILLGHSQAAVNPLLYCLLSKNFRRSVMDLIRHPTRVVRTRQQCKIRMTFRRDPVPSAEGNSSEKPVSCRPRNHHAPDPPPPTTSPCSNTGPPAHRHGDIPLEEIGHKSVTHNSMNNSHYASVAARSPSFSSLSSGYSSMRGSEISQNCQQCTLMQTSLPNQSSSHGVESCLSQVCSYPHMIPTMCHTCQMSHSTILTKRSVCFGDHRKVDVPSTIREESENSHFSQKSRSFSNVSTKVCFA